MAFDIHSLMNLTFPFHYTTYCHPLVSSGVRLLCDTYLYTAAMYYLIPVLLLLRGYSNFCILCIGYSCMTLDYDSTTNSGIDELFILYSTTDFHRKTAATWCAIALFAVTFCKRGDYMPYIPSFSVDLWENFTGRICSWLMHARHMLPARWDDYCMPVVRETVANRGPCSCYSGTFSDT